MSVWIPILTGLLAFAGAIAGHFVAFDLNSAAKRREVRRMQIERFAELISEDKTWLDNYRDEALFRTGTFSTDSAPHDKAYALYVLYFQTDLENAMTLLLAARREYSLAMHECYVARIDSAIAAGAATIAGVKSPQNLVDITTQKFGPYYQATLQALVAASKIVHATIPEKSQIEILLTSVWTFMRNKFRSKA